MQFYQSSYQCLAFFCCKSPPSPSLLPPHPPIPLPPHSHCSAQISSYWVMRSVNIFFHNVFVFTWVLWSKLSKQFLKKILFEKKLSEHIPQNCFFLQWTSFLREGKIHDFWCGKFFFLHKLVQNSWVCFFYTLTFGKIRPLACLVLQCVAVCCSVFQCVSVVSQCVAVCFWCVAVCYSVFLVCSSVLQCIYDVLQCVAVCC